MDHSIPTSRAPSPSPTCVPTASSVDFILSSPHVSDSPTHSANMDGDASPFPSSASESSSSFSDISYIQALLSESPSVDAVSVPSVSLVNIAEVQRKMIFVMLERVRREQTTRRRASRLKRTLSRRLARYTPAQLAAKSDARSERRHVKALADALLEATCMKREIIRAKRTAIFPQTFETVNIH